MWIYSKDGNKLGNSNQIAFFKVSEVANGYDEFLLYSDNTIIGRFRTLDEAKKELKQIYDALIAGQESYSVG